MQEVELTSSRLLRVWWAFVWRSAALWFVAAATVLLASIVCYYALTTVAGIAPFRGMRMGGQVLAAVMFAGIPVAGIIAMRLVLQGQFGRFRLALLETSEFHQKSDLECQAH